MITDLLDRGRGIEAENIARALLARVESTRGRDVLEVAEVLDLLGRAVRRSSKVTNEEKTEFAERAVAIKEKVLGSRHPDLATSLINLGVQRTLAGDPAAARPLLERALDIREATLGPDHLLVAGALQSLAGLLMTLHDDAGAKALLERAQRISRNDPRRRPSRDDPNARQPGDPLPGDRRLHRGATAVRARAHLADRFAARPTCSPSTCWPARRSC